MNIEEYRKSLEDYRAYDRSGQELTHWGISGMKWGRRRWQNEDGSLTEEGRIHYGVGAAREAARNEARVIKAQAKAKAYEEKQKVKLAVKEAKGKAEAEAIKLKAEKQHLVDQAKQDRKAVEAEAAAETKNRKIAASIEKKAESNRHKENSTFKKLIIGGAAVAGGIFIIKALRDKRVSELNAINGVDLKDKDLLSKDRNLLQDSYNAAQKRILDLQDKVSSSAKTEGQLRNIIKAKSGAITKLTGERDLLRNSYDAAQKMLVDSREIKLNEIPDIYRNQF